MTAEGEREEGYKRGAISRKQARLGTDFGAAGGRKEMYVREKLGTGKTSA